MISLFHHILIFFRGSLWNLPVDKPYINVSSIFLSVYILLGAIFASLLVMLYFYTIIKSNTLEVKTSTGYV